MDMEAREYPVAEEIGRRFRLRRGALGLSHEEVAKRIGFPTETVVAIELGRKEISLEELYFQASALDEEPGWFVEGIRWIPSGGPGVGHYEIGAG